MMFFLEPNRYGYSGQGAVTVAGSGASSTRRGPWPAARGALEDSYNHMTHEYYQSLHLRVICTTIDSGQ